jgi:hypothetical protein
LIDFSLAATALTCSGFLLLWAVSTGFSLKEAEKAVLLYDIQDIDKSEKYIIAPAVILWQFLGDCHTFVFMGVKMALSKDYRKQVIDAELLVETEEENLDE